MNMIESIQNSITTQNLNQPSVIKVNLIKIVSLKYLDIGNNIVLSSNYVARNIKTKTVCYYEVIIKASRASN